MHIDRFPRIKPGPNPPTEKEGSDDTENRNAQRGEPEAGHLVQIGFHADLKKKQDHTDLSETLNRRESAERLEPGQTDKRQRTDHHSEEQFTDDWWLAEA
jgi:hypothetical protein